MSPADSEWGRRLERYRHYLWVIARTHLQPRLWARLDPSGLVQQTMLEACQAREQFRGSTDAELQAWLRAMMRRNLLNALRDGFRDKRDLRLEESLARGSERLEASLTSPESRYADLLLDLADALAELPEAERQAVELVYLHHYTQVELAAHLGVSRSRAARLLTNGQAQLARRLRGGYQ